MKKLYIKTGSIIKYFLFSIVVSLVSAFFVALTYGFILVTLIEDIFPQSYNWFESNSSIIILTISIIIGFILAFILMFRNDTGELARQNYITSPQNTLVSPLEKGPIKCPVCRSTQWTANKKGFGLGKAAVGGILTGGLGLLGGFIGSGKIKITCLKCGYSWMAGKRKS